MWLCHPCPLPLSVWQSEIAIDNRDGIRPNWLNPIVLPWQSRWNRRFDRIIGNTGRRCITKLLSSRIGFKVGPYNFLTGNRYTFVFIPPPAREAAELLPQLLIPLLVIVLALNLLNSNRLLGNSKRTIKGNLPAVSFVGAIYTISFPNGLNKAF